VVPCLDEVERLKTFCEAKGIATVNVQFVIERSEQALPRLDAWDFDVCLIDGRHSFPSPFIDFYYMAERLKMGGILVVDDTSLWTGRVLSEFLQAEPEWRLAKKFPNTVVFEKLQEGTHNKVWYEQPFLRARSWRTTKLLRWCQMFDTLLRLVRARDLKTLHQKLARRIFKSGTHA
jgi:hypothetical protein